MLGFYRKPTKTDTTILFVSDRQMEHKLTAYIFYINRMTTLPITGMEHYPIKSQIQCFPIAHYSQPERQTIIQNTQNQKLTQTQRKSGSFSQIIAHLFVRLLTH